MKSGQEASHYCDMGLNIFLKLIHLSRFCMFVYDEHSIFTYIYMCVCVNQVTPIFDSRFWPLAKFQLLQAFIAPKKGVCSDQKKAVIHTGLHPSMTTSFQKFEGLQYSHHVVHFVGQKSDKIIMPSLTFYKESSLPFTIFQRRKNC